MSTSSSSGKKKKSSTKGKKTNPPPVPAPAPAPVVVEYEHEYVDDENENYNHKDEDENDDDVEYREVDPMAVIEERILALESWLEDYQISQRDKTRKQHQQVDAKHEEYIGLMEELEILGKKMRKTDKLLASNSQSASNQAKLYRKKEQYEQEVTNIVLYAESDPVFEDLLLKSSDGGDDDDDGGAFDSFMNANSLLGRPLETLTEMSGFEDSKAWNDSFNPQDSRSDFNSSNGSNPTAVRKGKKKTQQQQQQEQQQQEQQQLLESSIADLDMTERKNILALKKKLKVAKAMFENSVDDWERTKLLKKVTEYQKKLEEIKDHRHDDSSSDNGGASVDRSSRTEISENSMEIPKQSSTQASSNASSSFKKEKASGVPAKATKSPVEEDQTYILLKKKLAKATKLQQTSSDSETVKKLKKKIQEYLNQLKQYRAWEDDMLSFGVGMSEAVEKEKIGHERLTREEMKTELIRLVEAEQKEQDNRRALARSMVDSKRNYEYNDEDEESTDPGASDQNGLNLEKVVQEELKKVRLFRKKLKKVEEMMDDVVIAHGPGARSGKEFKKLEKKRKQYLSELGEGHASFSSLSIDASAMTESMPSSTNLMLPAEPAPTTRARVASATMTAPTPKTNHEEEGSTQEASDLLSKKLKKVERMIKEVEIGSADYTKLSKKKVQYLEELAKLRG
jgi:hypothetical protein